MSESVTNLYIPLTGYQLESVLESLLKWKYGGADFHTCIHLYKQPITICGVGEVQPAGPLVFHLTQR